MGEIRTIPPILTKDEWNALIDHGLEKPCSFTVFARTINGTKYYYVEYGSGADQAGKIAFGGPNNAGGVSGTDASAVIQAAVNALGADKEGDVFIKRDTYNIASDITIGKRTRLIAEMGTVFNVTNNLTTACIIISNINSEARWSIEGLKIEMNYYNGHAIYSAFAGQSGHRGNPTIRDVSIKEIGAGYCGIYLVDPFYMHVENIEVRDNNGTAIKLENDGAYGVHYGNSLFEKLDLTVNAENAIGIDIESGDVYVICLTDFHDVNIICGDYPGTVGVKLRGVQNCRFYSVNVEGAKTSFDLGPTSGNKESIWNYFFGCRTYTAEYALRFRNGAHRNCWYGGELRAASASNYVVLDENWYSSYTKSVHNIIRDAYLSSGYKNGGWATIFQNCLGFNPVGKINNPFGTILNNTIISPTQGTSATPTSGTIYRARGVDYLITVSGGSGVVIDVFDPAGTAVISGLATLTNFYLPVDYQIKITYSTAPTVIVCGL